MLAVSRLFVARLLLRTVHSCRVTFRSSSITAACFVELLSQQVQAAGVFGHKEQGNKDGNNDDMVEALLSDLRLGADAAELRRDAIFKVIDVTVAKSRAEHRSGNGGSGGDERNRDLADEFVQVPGNVGAYCTLYFIGTYQCLPYYRYLYRLLEVSWQCQDCVAVPIFFIFVSKKTLSAVLRIRIRMDPHLKSPPGSGSAWTDADPDPGGKKA